MPHWPIDPTQHIMPGEASFVDAPSIEPGEQPATRSSVPQRLSSRVSGTRLPYRTSDSSSAAPTGPLPSLPSPTPSEASTAAATASSPTHPGPPPAHGHPGLATPPEDAFFDANVGVRPRLRRNYVQGSSAHRSEQALPTVLEQATPVQLTPTPADVPMPAAPSQPAQATVAAAPTQLRHPPSLPPVLQQVLMPQAPIGPQSELLGFSYRSEPIEGEEDSWQIDMSYRVRITQQDSSQPKQS